jgi:hypothetical protein
MIVWLTGRLIDLVAEDNAIEDTIYHMTRALDNERVDLDRYMKVCTALLLSVSKFGLTNRPFEV